MATKPKHSQTQIRSRACKLLGTLCENSVPRVNHAVQSTADNRVPIHCFVIDIFGRWGRVITQYRHFVPLEFLNPDRLTMHNFRVLQEQWETQSHLILTAMRSQNDYL